MNSSQTPGNVNRLTPRFEQGLIYANQLHKTQIRKVGNIPYISHLLSVAALVLEAEGTENEAIAALLHDAIEDQGGAKTREEISVKFGAEVLAIVEGCTESDTFPKPPWKERKLRYLEQIKTGSSSVQLVSLADKLHNGRSLLFHWRTYGEELWTSFDGGKPNIIWFYQSLLKVYQTTPHLALTQEFEAVVSQLQKISSNH